MNTESRFINLIRLVFAVSIHPRRIYRENEESFHNYLGIKISKSESFLSLDVAKMNDNSSLLTA
jgi:hypothetical protein